MAENQHGLAQFLTEETVEEFTPTPYWEPETDSLIFYFKDEPSYSKRINDLATVFLSAIDDQLVGFEIKGIKRILSRLGRFHVGVHDHKVDLEVLLFAALAPEPEPHDFQGEYPDEFSQLFEAASKTEFDAAELCSA
jgi:hypothetical protein